MPALDDLIFITFTKSYIIITFKFQSRIPILGIFIPWQQGFMKNLFMTNDFAFSMPALLCPQ